MIDENSFGNLLKSFRARKGTKRGTQWTQQQIADALEVSRVTYNYWENNVRVPSVEYLEKIVAHLRLSKEDAEKLYRAATLVPPETPEIHTLPSQRNRFFTGREAHIEQLDQLLKENGTQPVSICGLGGIGKTQLALEYAHSRHPEIYRAVFWVNAASKETLQNGYDELLDRLELPERSAENPDKRVQAMKTWLEAHTSWLLILDNVDNLGLARSFLPAKPLGHIVLTTRSHIVGSVARRVEIEKMEPEEGQLFLLTRAGIAQGETKLDIIAPTIRDTAMRIVRFLGGLPLALDQAGAYIEETGVSLTDYVQLYHKERRSLLNRRGSSESNYGEPPEAVVTTVELSFTKACEQYPLVADILHFCAFIEPYDIPEEVLRRVDGSTFDALSLNEAIFALQRYSLIKRNAEEKTLSMHVLVRDVLLDSMSPDLRKQWFLCTVRTFNQIFPEVASQDLKTCKRLFPHASMCAVLMEDEMASLSELSSVRELLELFLKTADYMRKPGLEPLDNWKHDKPDAQEARFQRHLSEREADYGAEHPATVRSLNNFADFYLTHDKDEQAQSLFERALAIREHHLETVHPSTANSLMGLAKIAHRQGRREQAEALYQRAISILEQQLGATHPLIATYKQGYEDFLNNNIQRTKEYTVDFLRKMGRHADVAAIEAIQERDPED